MNKSIYSLVLADDIVRVIDRMAYEKGTSRSNMVNEILAEALSLTTPEKRMQEILTEMENRLSGIDTFRVLMQPSDSMISLKSALTYKYNPTVRYQVELNRLMSPDIGELRVSVRSQNSALRLYMNDFFKLWSGLEKMHIGNNVCVFDPDKYSRKLFLNPDGRDDKTVGQAISEYIRLFDRSLNLYFMNLNAPERSAIRIETYLLSYLAEKPAIV